MLQQAPMPARFANRKTAGEEMKHTETHVVQALGASYYFIHSRSCLITAHLLYATAFFCIWSSAMNLAAPDLVCTARRGDKRVVRHQEKACRSLCWQENNPHAEPPP